MVHDESHYLMQDADGNGTKALDTLRSISRHPRGAYGRFRMLHAAELAEQARLSTQIADNTKDISATDATDMRRAGLQAQTENLKKLLAALTKKLDDARQAVKADVDTKQGAARTRVAGVRESRTAGSSVSHTVPALPAGDPLRLHCPGRSG